MKKFSLMAKLLAKSLAYVAFVGQLAIGVLFFISAFADLRYTDLQKLIRVWVIMALLFVVLTIFSLPGHKVIAQEAKKKAAAAEAAAEKAAKEAAFEKEFSALAEDSENASRREALNAYLRDGTIPEYAPSSRG